MNPITVLVCQMVTVALLIYAFAFAFLNTLGIIRSLM